MDPEGYGSISAYRAALHEKIMNETIHGFNVTAYTIGLRGQDVSDEQEFKTNLNMLASSPHNVFEVTNMNEALQRFSDIADALYSITVTSKVKIEVPGGYDEGQVIRFTFDNVTAETPSNTSKVHINVLAMHVCLKTLLIRVCQKVQHLCHQFHNLVHTIGLNLKTLHTKTATLFLNPISINYNYGKNKALAGSVMLSLSQVRPRRLLKTKAVRSLC